MIRRAGDWWHDWRHGLLREPDTIVRVGLPGSIRLYAYRCRGARVGSLVEIKTRRHGVMRERVERLGRGSSTGRLKRARLVRDDG